MKLTDLVPAPYRWLAVAGLVAAFAGYFYWKGYERRDDSADLFEAKVQVIADQAAARAKEREEAQNKVTKEIRDGHAKDVARIRAHYERRLHDARSGVGPVPAPAERPVEPHGAASECPAGDEDLVAMIEFEERAAMDAAKLMAWQEWARKNGIPVE